jgi:hypothetical protein
MSINPASGRRAGRNIGTAGSTAAHRQCHRSGLADTGELGAEQRQVPLDHAGNGQQRPGRDKRDAGGARGSGRHHGDEERQGDHRPARNQRADERRGEDAREPGAVAEATTDEFRRTQDLKEGGEHHGAGDHRDQCQHEPELVFDRMKEDGVTLDEITGKAAGDSQEEKKIETAVEKALLGPQNFGSGGFGRRLHHDAAPP